MVTTLAAEQVIVNLGLGPIISQVIAENLAQEKKTIAATTFYLSFLLNASVSVVVAAVILVTGFPAGISGLSSSGVISKISIFLALDAVVNYNYITGATFFGLQKFRDLALLGTSLALTSQAVIVALVFASRSVVGWAAATVIMDLVYTIVMFSYLIKRLGRPVFDFGPKKLLKLSAPLYLSNLCSFAYNWFDRLFVIGFANVTAVALYGVATQVFGAYLSLISVLPNVLIPAFATSHGAGGRASLSQATRSSSRYVSYAAFPIAFALLATAKPVISLFAGVQYEGAVFPLAELVAFSTAAVLASTFTSALIVLRETGLYAVTVIVPLIASITVAFLTISSLGIVAASTARGLAMVLNLVLSLMLVQKKLSVTPDVKSVGKSFISGVALGLVTYLCQVVWYNRLLLPVYLLCGGLAYVFSMRILGAVSDHDIDLIRDILGPRFVTVVKLLSYMLVP
jgi:O-antigen/teichoic acid export membrane protein